MTDNHIRIPVSARMRKQPDGSFEMIDAEYVDTTADVVARFIINAFKSESTQSTKA